jgi:hypothetical protein
MKPESLRRRSCLLLVSVVLLQAALLVGLPSSSGSDPDIVDNLDGTKTAIWDLVDPMNYTSAGVSVSGGVAELERVDVGFVDTTEADFLNSVADHNVSINAGGNVSLAGNAGDLISVGDFSTAGPWSYESNSGGNLTVARDAVEENAYVEHNSGMTDVQFDSMDDIVTTGWIGVGSPGALVTQELVNSVEGPGSMNVSFDPMGNPLNWGGGSRIIGSQDWSSYNLIVFSADTNYTGLGLRLYVYLSDGVVLQDLPNQTFSSGWNNYSFSLDDFTGDITSIQEVRILVTNVIVPVLFYVDNIHLTFHKSFDESAWVNQTFTKPDPTSGAVEGVLLTFDYEVESLSNITLFNASVRVNNTVSDFISYNVFSATTPWSQFYYDVSSYMNDSGT